MIPWRIAEQQNLFDVALRAILPVAIRKVQVRPGVEGNFTVPHLRLSVT